MTQIKIKKARVFPSGEQFFPITHTKAVIDDNGYTAESRLGAMQDEINQKQLEVGAVPSDIYPTKGSTNWATSGGVWSELYDSTDVFTNSSEVTWSAGNINGDGVLVTNYANMYTIVDIESNVEYRLRLNSTTSFNLNTYKYVNNKWNRISELSGLTGDVTKTFTVTDSTRILFLFFDKPTAAQAQAIPLSVDIFSEKYVKKSSFDSEPIDGSTNPVTSGGVYNAIAGKVDFDSICDAYSWDFSYGGDFTWELGTIHDDGKSHASSSYYHLYIPVSELRGCGVSLKAKSTKETAYALLKNIGFTYTNEGLDISSYYCNGYNSRISISAGQKANFTIPDDCNYIYIECGQTSGQYNYPPESGSYYIYKWSSDSTDIVKNSEEIEKLDNYTIGSLIEPLMVNGNGVNANTGRMESVANLAVSDFYPIYGAKYIRVTKSLLGSSQFGLAFYSYFAQATYISGVVFSKYDAGQSYEIVDIAVPEGAEWIKLTAYASTHARHFTPWFKLIYGANELFKDAVNAQMATQIMRSCKSISQGVLANDATTNYAFSANMYILGSYAYVTYGAGNTLNGDSPSPTDQVKGLQAKISLETNEVIETLTSTVAGLKDENGNDVTGYKPNCNVPVKNGNNQVAMVGQLVIAGSRDPIISTTGFGTPEYISNPTYQMCRLQYEAGGTSYDVRFSIANYRQMLVDLGYVSTYSAPAYDGFDNNCIIYDADSNKFYDLICTVSTSSLNLPLMLLESTDTYTWTVKARIGTNLWKANEIKGVCKDGKIYATIRQMASVDALSWLVYDINNNTVVSNGTFHTGVTVSRPYTFIFNDDIYMVVNVNPSVYGLVLNGNSNDTDTRTEVNIYEVVNDVPVFVRKVNNPTGINYHCWEQIPPYTVSGKSAHMTGYGAVYCAFSEDRRLLYKRMFSQVSFGDVTPLFAKLRYNYLLL